MAAEYQKTIDAYVSKGYLRKVNLESTDAPAAWYLPHFPIVRMDKPSTKVRIVFDCSAKCDGVSLNDVIHPGPKLQNDLFRVLIRFRRNPIVLACDIREMYLQIKIDEKDRPYFCMLWRNLDVEGESSWICDPLGFVNPFIVVAKILLQELWARGYGWDDEIADEIVLRIAK